MNMTCERLTLGQISVRTENEHLARYRFAMQLVEGLRVADIACGTGDGTQMLAKNGAMSVIGMDISEEAIDYSRKAHQASNASYMDANAQKLTAIPEGAFDIVVSFETIEHLPDVDAYLDEMQRILRPGGTFLVSTPDRRISSVLHCFLGRPKNPFHVREFTQGELLDLLSIRFKIKACYGQGFVPSWLVFWPVQVFIKALTRIIGTAGARAFRDNLYGDRGNVSVILKPSSAGVANFWVVVCVRPDNA